MDRLLCMVELSAMNLSSGEAAEALQNIEASQQAIRVALKGYRGHLYLWLWGCIWIAMALLNWRDGQAAANTNFGISAAGVVATLAIGFVQSRKIRGKVDRRFIAVCLSLLVFGYAIWPFFFGGIPHSYKAAYGYFIVIWMEIYMVAGLWFDNNLRWFWIGFAVTLAVVATLLLLPALFWPLCAGLGAALVACGFYIRFA